MSDLILDGIFLQEKKAERPIFVTPSGILMLVSELQPYDSDSNGGYMVSCIPK